MTSPNIPFEKLISIEQKLRSMEEREPRFQVDLALGECLTIINALSHVSGIFPESFTKVDRERAVTVRNRLKSEMKVPLIQMVDEDE